MEKEEVEGKKERDGGRKGTKVGWNEETEGDKGKVVRGRIGKEGGRGRKRKQ